MAQPRKQAEVLKMKYDLHKIMRRAWALFRKGVAAFAECLHRAWASAKAQPVNDTAARETARPTEHRSLVGRKSSR